MEDQSTPVERPAQFLLGHGTGWAVPCALSLLRALAVAGASLLSGAALATTTINHQFTAATINPGDVSVYKITVANSDTVPLTAAAVTEVLPATITIVNPPNIVNGCGFTVNAAAPGTSTVYLTGGTIPAGTGIVDGTCTFQISVTSTTPGNQIATIPANTTPDATTSGYTALDNGVPVFNTTPASATLLVNTLSNPTGSKTFAPSPAVAGDPVTLTITLHNPNAGATMPLTTFTDSFPAGMVVANPAGASTTCSGTGFVNGTLSPAPAPGDGAVTLSGGTIGQSGNCTVTLKVTVPTISGTSQAFNNAVAPGAVGNTRGLTSPAFNRSLTVNTPISVTKTIGPPTTIPGGQPTLMAIRIGNASTANALAITSFADDLTGTTLRILTTASTPNAAPANPSVSCTGTGAANGTLTAPPDLLDQTLSLAGAVAGRSGTCTISAYVTSNVDGSHVNTIPANAVVNPNSYASPGPVTASLTANAQLNVAKTVTVSNVAPGQWTEFSVAISNFSGGPVTAVTFKDVLPSNGAYQMTLFNAGSGFYATDAGCSGGTFTGTDPSGTSTGTPPTAADAGLLWTGGTIVGGVGSNPGVCTINLWAQLPASATTGLNFTNSIPTGSITGTGPAGGISNVNSGSANVVTIASGAVVKGFSPSTIAQGQLATLTVTLYNRTVVPLTGVSLTDNLPPGVTLAANPAPTNGCGGALQAFPNDAVVKLTGGTVAARPVASQDSNCSFSVKVTGTAVGTYTNTINPANFTSNEGVTIPSPVSANLAINTGLTAVKTFTPSSVTSGGVSVVKLTVTNTSSGQLTNVSLDDNTFSAGLKVANPANAATNCAGSPTLVVNPGATDAQLLGATLAAGAGCDFSFDVVTSGAGPWSDAVPVGRITSAEGASNAVAVTATLTAASVQININKSFNPVIVTGGQPSVLEIDLTNPSASVITGVGFTDTFPVGIIVYSVANASTTCAGGTVTAIPGDGKVLLTGATLAASSACSVFVTTTSTRFLNLTNTIPAGAVVSDQGVTNATGTSATLSTLQGLNVLKAFSPAYVVPGQVATLTMSLVSSFDTSAPAPITLTGVSYTDTLPNGVFIAAVPNASTTCAGTGPGGLAVVTPANGGLSGSVTVTQGTILPGTTCSVTVDTVANTLGAYNNVIPANSVTTDEGIPNQTAANATLFVVNRPTVSKAFANPTRNPGQTTLLTVTITNGASIPLTGVALTDTLPVGVAIASSPGTGGTCASTGGGVVAAVAGGGTLSVAGATIAALGSCTFFANVVSNTPGVYMNNIPAGGIVTDQGLTNVGPATATLTVNAPPTVSKVFTPVTIASGGTSTLTITLGNPNASATALSSPFTDALPGNVSVAATPNASTTCTGGSVSTTATSVTLAGGSVQPGGCTISVDVTASLAGTYTNVVAAGQLSTSVGVNQQPATASLGVGPGALVPPTISKSFSPSTIFVNGTSVLTISLGNPNAGPLTLISALTDSLPVGVFVATPSNVGGTCSGSGTASAGVVAYAGGSTIPAGGCTILVNVTSATPGSYTNTIPAAALVTDGGSPTLPATAGLVVKTLTPPTVLKSFSPGTINPGGTSTLTIVLGNANASAATLSSPFADTLPGNVSVASSPNASTTCTGGSVSTTVSSVTLTGGSVPAGGCTVSVDVTSSTPGGPYTNTILAGALQTDAGNNGAPATANLFVNPFQPPSVAKSFTPAVIGAGGISKLTLTISNGNATAASLTADLVDTFPGPGLAISATPNLLLGSGCTAGKVVANAGATSVTYQSGGALPGNGGCTIQVDVTSSTVRSYTNTVPAGTVQTTVGNNVVAASASLQVLALPTIAKAFSPASIPLGASSTLTLTLGNTNAVALTLAGDFVDTLPANLVLGSPATVGGTCASANVVASAGGPSVTFKSGASIPAAGCTITVPVTTALAGGYDNVIGVGTLVTTIGPNPSGATAHLDVLQADLSITKDDHVVSVVPGTATTYTIVVSNAGPSPVVNAAVADTLPGAIASATWTCAATAGSSCGAASGSGSINSHVSLLVGGSATYTLVATISPSATGSLSNTATVTAPVGVTELNPGNNMATDTDTLTPQADMQVVKTGPAAPVPGQNVVYALTVTDLGPSTATTVALSDPLPAGTTFVSLASPGGWSCTTPAVGSGGTASCTIASLLPSAPAVFTLTVKLDAAVLSGTLLQNTATVTTATPDPNPNNNTSTTTGTAAPSADLSVVKTGPATAVPGGANLVFTTVVTNNGPSDAQNVSVADPTPANLTFVSASGPCAGGFPCALGTLAAGGSVTFGSTYSIPSGYPAPAPIVNKATVSSPTPDPTPGNDTSTATVLVPNGVSDIAVAKTVDNPAPTVGTNVTFTVTLKNNGPSDATSLVVTDVLPTGLTYVSSTPSQGTYVSATGVWAVGSVVNGASATLAIVATVTQGGAIVNTATKTGGDQTDPNPSNNSGTAVVNGPTAADIQVQKTVDNPTPAAGNNVTFAVTVLNAGPSNATGVAVTDVLPGGLTFVSATPTSGTNYSSGTGVWTIGNLANGASATLALVATVTANGTYVNTATKTAENELDPNTSNDSAVAGVVAGGGGATFADLGIVKTGSPDPVRAGQPLTYTLVVTNRGPNDATNVTVTDPLPATVSLVTATSSQGGCGGTPLTCLLGGLPAGNSATISIVVSVSAAAAPTITNTASVTATETDPNPGDNSASATTNVIPVADVAITKSVSNPAPLVTQAFTFTVTATNNGPSTANGVVVKDVVPANLSLSLATPSQGMYDPVTGWAVGTLANGASATLTLAVIAVTPGPFTNTATKTGETELDPNPANDSASASGGVGVVADLAIAKNHFPATFVRGATGTFTLTVSNVGTGPTNAPVTVTDALPVGFTPTLASGPGWTCSPPSGQNVTCSRIDVLGVGAAWPAISVTVNVLQSAAASITNSASVSGGGDITPGNDTATDTVPVVSSADLSVVKTGPANAIPGTNVMYTLVVTNNGPSDAANVQVNDPTPTNLTFVSASGPCASGFQCTLGPVASGGSVTITATFSIPANYTAPSPIVNVASVSSSTPDPNMVNNTSSASTSVAADLAVTKTIGGIGAGGLATYTIVVTNNGPSTATNVVLTDPLPGELTFFGLTTTAGSCTSGSTVSCALGTMAAGATVTVTVTVLVPEAPLPRIRNTASVTADQYDPDLTNNSSSADSSAVPSIPTLSEWGLILLAAALALAGARFLRR